MQLKRIDVCVIVMIVSFGICEVNGEAGNRQRRADEDDKKSIGMALKSFFSNLFSPDSGQQNSPKDTSAKDSPPLEAVDQVQNALNKDALLNSSSSITTASPPITKTKTNTIVSVPSSSTRTQSTMASASWSSFTEPKEEGKCYIDAVLQNFCVVPSEMTDVSFWDIYSVMFADTVLDELMLMCSDGDWCLRDSFDYWEALIVERVQMVTKSKISSDMCRPEMSKCLSSLVESYIGCSAYQQMKFTIQAIDLLCELKTSPSPTQQCYEHVIESMHVTLADVLRKKNSKVKRHVPDQKCLSPEAKMTKSYICVVNSCEMDIFRSFPPWKWFTPAIEDMISGCHMNTTICESLLQVGGASSNSSQSSKVTPSEGTLSSLTPSSSLNFGSSSTLTTTQTPEVDGDIDSHLQPNVVETSDLQTLMAASIATMVTVLMVTFLVCLCYKRKRRDVLLKDGYQRLLTEGGES